MPNLTWEELEELRHAILQIEEKLIKDRKFVDGMMGLITDIVNKHEKEEE